MEDYFMSDQNKSGEGQKTDGEGQKVDVTEIQKRLEQLESSYSRVLNESKEHKTKAQEYKAKLEEIEKKGIETSGDVQKQLEYERKEREKIEKEAKALKNKTLDYTIRNTVSKFAKDVHSIDDLLNQPDFTHILRAGIDKENLTVDENAAKEFVNKVTEAKPYLKKHTEQAQVDSSKPKTTNLKDVNIDNLKKGEFKDHLKSALADW
jgi:hypothetical protein